MSLDAAWDGRENGNGVAVEGREELPDTPESAAAVVGLGMTTVWDQLAMLGVTWPAEGRVHVLKYCETSLRHARAVRTLAVTGGYKLWTGTELKDAIGVLELMGSIEARRAGCRYGALTERFSSDLGDVASKIVEQLADPTFTDFGERAKAVLRLSKALNAKFGLSDGGSRMFWEIRKAYERLAELQPDMT